MSAHSDTASAAGNHRLQQIAAALFVVIFAVGAHVIPLEQSVAHWWADTAWTLASVLAAWRCFVVAATLRGREGKAWRLFGLGCVAWFLGMLHWDYRELVIGQVTPFPALSDLGFLLLVPLFAAGLISSRREVPNTSFTIMEISQIGIFISCIVAVHVVLFYGPLSRVDLSIPYRVTALAYPVLYMALLVQAISSLWIHAGVIVRRPLILIALAIAVQAVVNSFYAYSLLGHSYEAGGYLDIAWVIGFALMYGAAEERLRMRCSPIATPIAGNSAPRLGGLIPPAVLLITLAVLMLFSERLQSGMIHILEPVAFVLVGFLALREWASNNLNLQLAMMERASEEKIRQLAHVVPVGILRVDLRGDCHYANEYCSEITGVPVSQLLGQGWVQALHPEDRERVRRQCCRAEACVRASEPEFRFARPDGKTVWVMGQTTLERGSNGEIVGYIASITDITVRRESEEALRDSEQRFRRVFAAMPAMASIASLSDGRFFAVNDTFLSVTGFTRDEVIGRTSDELNLWVAPFDRAAVLQSLADSGGVDGIDWRIRNKSGGLRDLLGSFEMLKLGDEECLLAIAQDVTDRRQAEIHMKKLSSALEQTADAVMITNREGVIEYVNQAFVTTTGYAVDEVLGKYPNILSSGRQGKEFYREVWSTILSGKILSDVFVNKKKDGSLYYEEKTITPLKDGCGAITHFVSTGHDITERMQTQERLQYLAHHDVLTGLPNRSLFLDRLKQSLAHARWHSRLVAVLFFDADRFKTINDTLGHDVGDQLLQAIGQRLVGCLRERDTVARFGGDEFVMVLTDVACSSDVRQVANKILTAMQPPFEVDNITLHVTASIGISMSPNDGEEASDLLSKADAAMYRAKDMGRNHFQFYSKEMGARAFERLSMENSLRLALERDQFVVHYQPQVDVRDGGITGFEALLRWQHPEMGLVSPQEFIPLLEETGLIIPVGEWVLRSACAQLKQWHNRGWNHLRMAVNLSGIQFNSSGLMQVIMDALAANRLNPESLELEITESILMHNDGSAAALLQSFNKLGIGIGLDDFGTGYSSLSYLRRFPIDTLKIDRSFVRDIPDDAEDAAITQAIIVMGKSLNLELVAEGVETKIQANYLQSLGCHIMQGFLFSRPLPADEVTKLLEAPRIFGT